ncbi:hypothetical protein CKO28_14295 [Rhodovibrio sodomensis]|uniref:Heme exporter protein D n=1 Tax=Rhodovibrio sodomensis TaxID=1088 RepID=A0ABS1DFF6_9PROT|nr:hypothetical protein [Rhodovibrio sodomensis]
MTFAFVYAVLSLLVGCALLAVGARVWESALSARYRSHSRPASATDFRRTALKEAEHARAVADLNSRK